MYGNICQKDTVCFRSSISKMFLTFSSGLNVTGKLMLVPELRMMGCGYLVVKKRLDGILSVKTQTIISLAKNAYVKSFLGDKAHTLKGLLQDIYYKAIIQKKLLLSACVIFQIFALNLGIFS